MVSQTPEFGFFWGLEQQSVEVLPLQQPPPLRSGQKDAAALSIGLINLLGVLGLLGLPLLASTLQFNHIDTAALLVAHFKPLGMWQQQLCLWAEQTSVNWPSPSK